VSSGSSPAARSIEPPEVVLTIELRRSVRASRRSRDSPEPPALEYAAWAAWYASVAASRAVLCLAVSSSAAAV
jgi:hypothetical protein